MNDVKNFSDPLLKEIADITDAEDLTGAYSLRKDGMSVELFSTENIKISPKGDKPGIDIRIKSGSRDMVHMPVILTKPGLDDTVYNDFFIGEGADVVIIAGCGIHNDGHAQSRHVGIHTFYLEKGAKVKYIEKHYGEGEGTGEKILNPETVINMGEGSHAEFDMIQLKGVDSTVRTTTATLEAGAFLLVTERVLTHDQQTADSNITVVLKGCDSSVQVVSRSVAQNSSTQSFFARVEGHTSCKGHVQCDAIIMDNAKVRAVPEISAFHQDAQLVHEAAIGKIAGDQIL
ncbi:MAG: SufD family Fe-S cluster assembly protein, partial [Deferribacteraceae bacterium]|nr:SufD family Fe-S cluster assembly protein [Deferribacteraceae bacterium]